MFLTPYFLLFGVIVNANANAVADCFIIAARLGAQSAPFLVPASLSLRALLRAVDRAVEQSAGAQ